MRFRNIALIIVLILSLILILVYYLVRNPYLGLAGYVLQLIGDIMLIYSVMAGAKRKSRNNNTGDSSVCSSVSSETDPIDHN